MEKGQLDLRLSAACASLSNHIMHVISLCAEEQMSRVDACLYVTSMQHKQSILYRAVVQGIREYMCVVDPLPIAKLPISPGLASYPQPTAVSRCLVNFRPETFLSRAACAVPAPITNRLANLIAKLGMVLAGKTGEQATTTMAVSPMDTVEIKSRLLYIIHATVSLLDGGRARGVSAPPGLSMSNYTTNGGY